jgi:hypothetical protein
MCYDVTSPNTQDDEGTTMAKKKLDPADLLSERMMVPVSPRLRKQIERYHWQAKIGSRAATLRHLIALGLKAERERAPAEA